MNWYILAIALSMGGIVYFSGSVLISFIQLTAWAFKKNDIQPKSITDRIAILSVFVILYWYLTWSQV